VFLLESDAPPGRYEARNAGKAATKLVDELYQKLGYYYEVMDRLQTDKTLDEPVRKLALQIGNSRKWGDADKLRREARETVSSSDKTIEEYKAALEKAQKANGWEPKDPAVFTVLGAAQYRVGSYEDALKILANSDRMLSDAGEDPDLSNVAFTAMSLHRLARVEEAKAALERLRNLCKEEDFAEDEEAQALLAEAEKLIEGEK
jgi:tetratricopeptide (TPR) repeat protein